MDKVAVVTGNELDDVLFVGTYEEATGVLKDSLNIYDPLDLKECFFDSQTGLVELGSFKSWK